MHIPPELSERDRCLLCQRSWEVIYGSDWKSGGALYPIEIEPNSSKLIIGGILYPIDTTHVRAICWRCEEQCEELAKGQFSDEMSRYKKSNPTYLHVADFVVR